MTKYNIGDYVEVDMRWNRNEEHGIIDSIVVENGYSIANIVLVSQFGKARAIIHGDEDEYYGSYNSPDEVIRKLQPSEIIFNFGSGIKGTIHNYPGNLKYWFGVKWDGWKYILPIEPLTEPMKSRVLEVLKAQEEE